ncbi:MAG TPA: hypothetical protein VIK11_10905, partial [Tepidiformaceae bacterium]
MRPTANPSELLYELVPSPLDDEPVVRARSAFSGLAGVGGFALEAAATDAGLRFYLRTRSEGAARYPLGQLRAAYPQAAVHPPLLAGRPRMDPLAVGEQEVAVQVKLQLARDSAFPLDTDVRHGDPFTGVLAALVASRAPGERVVCQLVVGPPPSARWAFGIRARVARQERPYRPASTSNTSTDLFPFVALAGVGALGFRLYSWYQHGDFIPLLAVGGAAVVATPMAALVWSRLTAGREPLPALLADQKLAFPPFSALLRVVAIGEAGGGTKRLRRVAEDVAASYMGF